MYRRRDVEEVERPVHDEHPAGEPVYETDEGTRTSFWEHSLSFDWSPAQFLSWLFGIIFIVFGAVALARAGFAGDGHVSVGGLHHTPWLGLIHVLFGLMLVLAGSMPEGLRGFLTFLGSVALAFGLIVAIEPDAMHGGLGVHSAHGVFYVATGVVLLVMSVFSPFMRGGERTYSRHRHTLRR